MSEIAISEDVVLAIYPGHELTVCISAMGEHVGLSFQELTAIGEAVAQYLESAAEPEVDREGWSKKEWREAVEPWGLPPDQEGEGWAEDARRQWEEASDGT